jgi:hypothetical protein
MRCRDGATARNESLSRTAIECFSAAPELRSEPRGD